MRRTLVMLAALVLFICPSSFAQEWIQYASKADLFGVNFPSEPKVQDIAYATEFGISLPGHVYTADQGQSRYSITAVDLKDSERIHTAGCRSVQGEGRRGRRLHEQLAGGRAGSDDFRVVEIPAAECQGDALRMERGGSGRGPAAAAHQCRRLANVRRNSPARHPSLHPRGHGASARAGARAVPAVADVHRRGRQVDSLSIDLHDRLFRRMAVPRTCAAARGTAAGARAAGWTLKETHHAAQMVDPCGSLRDVRRRARFARITHMATTISPSGRR